MRKLCWVLLLAALAPWAFLAFGETAKKAKTVGKKLAKPADFESLSEPERRAIVLEQIAQDQHKKRDEKQKAERAGALKSAAKLEAVLKSASDDEKSALLYELGVTHLQVNNAVPALRAFRQLADSPDEWDDRARIHLFDVLLYDNLSLDDAADVLPPAVDPLRRTSVGNSSGSALLLAPHQVSDKPLSPDAVAANLAARRALLEFINGQPTTFAANSGGAPIWSALCNWKPEFADVLDEKSDASWLVRLAELHFATNDHETVAALASAVVADKKLHPTKAQKSFAYFRRAQAAYQLHATMRPAERGLKEIVADYANAVKAEKDAPWAGDAVFLQGNVLWNQFQDDAAAIKLWKELLARYPRSASAENAGYNIGVLYQLYGASDKAKAAFRDFRDRFPDSRLLAGLNSDGLAAHIKPIRHPDSPKP